MDKEKRKQVFEVKSVWTLYYSGDFDTINKTYPLKPSDFLHTGEKRSEKAAGNQDKALRALQKESAGRQDGRPGPIRD